MGSNLLRFTPPIGADMSLSCRIRGSVSVWESWWVAAGGEQGEGDEGVRGRGFRMRFS